MRRSVLLIVALVALVGPQASPASRQDGRITAIVGESGEVGPSPRFVVMDADGKNARVRLGYVYDAEVSPDGRLIAFDQIGAGMVHGSYEREIWLSPAGPGKGRRLVRNGANIDWSPDGKAIAFVRYPRDGGAELWVEDVYTGMQRRVVGNGQEPDWSPDSRKFAFTRGKDIWVVDRDGSSPRRLIRNGEDPRWSPTGDRIAFVRESQIETDIYIARANGSAVHHVGYGYSVAWSPRGDELAVAEFRAVVRIRPDGTHRTVIHRECCAWGGIDWVR